jgi:hypothetical protein
MRSITVRNPGSVQAAPAGGVNLVQLALLGGAGLAGYEFLYKPYAIRRELERATAAAAAASLAKGHSLTDSVSDAVAGACVVTATVYKVPPNLAAPLCQGVGVVVTKGAVLAAKGAVIAGKAIGKGTVTAVKAVGHAGAVTGKTVGKAGKFVITAPTKTVAAVLNKIIPGKYVPAPVKKVVNVIKKASCLWLCGIEDEEIAGMLGELGMLDTLDAELSRQTRQRQTRPAQRNPLAARPRQLARTPNPFASHAALQGLGALPALPARSQQKRPAGVSPVRVRRGFAASEGRAFYGQHLV